MRWATFDCYGTLIDWNGGIRTQLARLWGEERADELLARYHELEPQVQAESFRSYRDVLTLTLERLARDESLALRDGETAALARSLPEWQPFPEVRESLEDAKARGWRLAILSNTDRDYIDASIRRIGVSFDEVVVAEEIGSYKPAHGHWHEFFARTGADRAAHVHVGASHFHDIAPATALGLPTIWINRLHEEYTPAPTRMLPDLERLPEVLDELVAP